MVSNLVPRALTPGSSGGGKAPLGRGCMDSTANSEKIKTDYNRPCHGFRRHLDE